VGRQVALEGGGLRAGKHDLRPGMQVKRGQHTAGGPQILVYGRAISVDRLELLVNCHASLEDWVAGWI